jgi:serine/threonine protein kinase
MPEQGPLSNRVLGGRYLLGELLGEGGFGEVYQAINRPLNRQQAIKVLLEKHLRAPRFRERFIREAQTLAALDHPNIVHVDELGEERDLVYLVMPYISGGTLHQLLKQRAGPLGLAETQHYLEHICGALGYARAPGGASRSQAAQPAGACRWAAAAL